MSKTGYVISIDGKSYELPMAVAELIEALRRDCTAAEFQRDHYKAEFEKALRLGPEDYDWDILHRAWQVDEEIDARKKAEAERNSYAEALEQYANPGNWQPLTKHSEALVMWMGAGSGPDFARSARGQEGEE